MFADTSDAALDEAVAHYRAHGWARLGKLANSEVLDELRARANAIMLGEVTYDGLFFQHDSDTGRYEDLAYGEGSATRFATAVAARLKA